MKLYIKLVDMPAAMVSYICYSNSIRTIILILFGAVLHVDGVNVLKLQ